MFSIEVENGIDPLIANTEYTAPASAANQSISVERGAYGNYGGKPGRQGLLMNGLRIASVNKGYYYFRSTDPIDDMDNYGALRTLQLLESVGKEWNAIYPDLYPMKKDIFVRDGAPDPSDSVSHPDLDKNDDADNGTLDNNSNNEARIGIGDISLRNGGPFYVLLDSQGNFDQTRTQHSTHQNGLGVDIRYMRNNDTEGRVNFDDQVTNFLYSKELTEKLVNILFSQGVFRVYVDYRTEIQESSVPNRQIIHIVGHQHHLHADLPILNIPTGSITFTSDALSIPADGISRVRVNVNARDLYGFPLVSINVRTTRGLIIKGERQGTELNVEVDGASQSGTLSFELQSSIVPGDARITVNSVPNGITGTLAVSFTQMTQ